MIRQVEYITENFRRNEFICPDCGKNDIDVRLVLALQMMRDKAGVPIWTTSGCRCTRWNRIVGGGENSQHLIGYAADVVVQGYDPMQMMILAEQIPQFNEGGIGIYDTHIHVDIRGKVARWDERSRKDEPGEGQA